LKAKRKKTSLAWHFLQACDGFFREEAKSPHFLKKMFFVFLHTIFLLGLTVLLQYISFIRLDEVDFLKSAAVVKHDIFHSDEKPFGKDVVFLNVSKDVAIADDDEYGPPDSTMKGAQRVITDRVKLAKLFSILNQHPDEYKYVLCDVLFEKPGPGDELLKPQIEKLHRIVASAVWENGKAAKPIYNIPSGIVNYTAVNKSVFTKIPLYYNDSLKSLPVVMFERTTHHVYTKTGLLTHIDGRPTFNTVIPEFYLRQYDMVTAFAQKNINTYYLGELLADPDCFSVLKNKFIVIGDFDNDLHITYLGRIPGSLILWDAYLTLYSHQAAISTRWLLMLFVFYFLLSYWVIIHPDKKLQEIHKKIRIPFLSKFLISYISFIGILILINIFSYFYFGTFVSLFYIATYLTFIQVVFEKLPVWRKSLYDYMMEF
jgi:hypothetical protein